MSKRFSNYLKTQGELQPHRKAEPGQVADILRLTPGQYAELCKEQGVESLESFEDCNGQHPIQVIYCNIQATGDNVILCPRDDLFFESESDTGVRMVSFANSVTSIPDNLGCCEIISVGEMVRNVKVGDVAFIDFFEVKQGYVVQNDECYIAGADAFKAFYDPIEHQIIPGNNYVIAKRNLDRFKDAWTGSSTLYIPDFKLTDGQISGKSSCGEDAAHTTFAEVVRVGKLDKRPRPGLLTRVEAQLLDVCLNLTGDPDTAEGFWESVQALREETLQGRVSDINKGDLVGFCLEIATPIRVRGEFMYIVPYDNVLAVIDDDSIMNESRRQRYGRPSSSE